MQRSTLAILVGALAIVGLAIWVQVSISEKTAGERQMRRIIKGHTRRPRVEYRTFAPGGIAISQDVRLEPVLALGTNAVPLLVEEYASGVSQFQELRHSFGLARFGGNDVRMNVISAGKAIGARCCWI